MTKLKAIWKRVIIKVKEVEKETSFWIVLADTWSKEQPKTWEIIEVWKLPEWIDLKAWDTVFFRQYSPTEIEVDGQQYLIMDAEDILAKIA